MVYVLEEGLTANVRAILGYSGKWAFRKVEKWMASEISMDSYIQWHRTLVILNTTLTLRFYLSRVSLIFKIKVTKRVKVSDMGLLQRLTPLVLFYVVYLVIWTVAGHPVRQKYHLINKVPFYACTESWWDHSIAIRA